MAEIMWRRLLWPLYQCLENPRVYDLAQWVGRPTVNRFRQLFRENIQIGPEENVLDLGCGPGNYRDCFSGMYYGVDINPRYLESARRRHKGHFLVMDCTALQFQPKTFEHVVSIATSHHLSDRELLQSIHEAQRVCTANGLVHIIDAILPFSSGQFFKQAYFRVDRGKYARYLDPLVNLLNCAGKVTAVKTIVGPLHDVCYVRVERQS